MAILLNIRETMSFLIETGKSLLKKHEMAYQFVRLSHDVVFRKYQKVDAHLVEGTVKGTNLAITILYIGSEHSLHEFVSRVCSHPFRMVRKEQFPFRCAASFSSACSTEMIVVSVERPFAESYSEQGFLLLPSVFFVLDLRKPMHEITQRMSKHRRGDLRRIEKLHYTYTVHRQDSRILGFFYWKMYLPYATKRFDKAADIKTFLESRIAYRLNGGVVMAYKDGQPQAGFLFQVQNKELIVRSLGVYEGNQELVRASEGALFHLIEWAKARGIESLNFGITVPFLRDGIFIYKKEWGMSIREQINQSLCALKFNSLTEGSLSFLKQNPFLIHDRRNIKGVVLLDHNPNKDELRHLFARCYLPDLASLIVISYDQDSSGSSDGIVSGASCDSSESLAPSLRNICMLLNRRGYHARYSELESMP